MNDDYANNLLAQMFQQAQAQFGDAVKSHWVNSNENCPGCGGEVGALKFKGRMPYR